MKVRRYVRPGLERGQSRYNNGHQNDPGYVPCLTGKLVANAGAYDEINSTRNDR